MAIHIIGAGLAGCEAAWQLTRRGIPVILHEMRPGKSDPAHHTPYYSELVCSNSLRANNIENAVGLLKEEMRRLDSLIIAAADAHQVPAGGALAVDREGFAQAVTRAIRENPLITVVEEEVTDYSRFTPEDYVITASGPLTSGALAEAIQQLVQKDYFHFFDAAAPIVTLESLDPEKVYKASRYDKGEAAYYNCPFTREEYLRFWNELCQAETAPVKDFEHNVFEACMPIEEMALRGEDTMRFGPLKPVGLPDPRTGEDPYAVVQLRQDNGAGTLYNIVGFQTHLKWPEQKRVFRLIPGLENAEFVRYGVMHKNSYLNSPPPAGPGLFPPGASPFLFRRPDDWSGRVCGKCRLWVGRRHLCGPGHGRETAGALPPGNGHRGFELLYQQSGGEAFPAHEHQFWVDRSLGRSQDPGQKRKKCGHCSPKSKLS